MHYVTFLFWLRTVIFLMLIIGSFFEWRRDLAINELLALKDQEIKALQKEIR